MLKEDLIEIRSDLTIIVKDPENQVLVPNNALRTVYDLNNRGLLEKNPLVSIGFEVKDWIDKWIDLFPDGVTSGGVSVKGNKLTVLSKMEKFIKNYPEYTTETIFEATKTYIELKRRDKWNFMQRAHYFISKTEDDKTKTSNLADMCNLILSKEKVYMNDVKEEGRTIKGSKSF